MTVASTSILAYHSEIKGAKEQGQDEQIFQAILKAKEPMTGRMVQAVTGLEINCVSRSLNNLWTSGRIECYFEAKCRITNRKAKHYVIKEKQLNFKF